MGSRAGIRGGSCGLPGSGGCLLLPAAAGSCDGTRGDIRGVRGGWRSQLRMLQTCACRRLTALRGFGVGQACSCSGMTHHRHRRGLERVARVAPPPEALEEQRGEHAERRAAEQRHDDPPADRDARNVLAVARADGRGGRSGRRQRSRSSGRRHRGGERAQGNRWRGGLREELGTHTRNVCVTRVFPEVLERMGHLHAHQVRLCTAGASGGRHSIRAAPGAPPRAQELVPGACI